MHAQTALLQGEMAELRGEFAELRGELRGDFDSKFADLRISTQRIVAAGVATNVVALIGGMVM